MRCKTLDDEAKVRYGTVCLNLTLRRATPGLRISPLAAQARPQALHRDLAPLGPLRIMGVSVDRMPQFWQVLCGAPCDWLFLLGKTNACCCCCSCCCCCCSCSCCCCSSTAGVVPLSLSRLSAWLCKADTAARFRIVTDASENVLGSFGTSDDGWSDPRSGV